MPPPTATQYERDALRSENEHLKQSAGFVGSDLLVRDFESRKSEMDAKRAQLEELKNRCALLQSQARS